MKKILSFFVVMTFLTATAVAQSLSDRVNVFPNPTNGEVNITDSSGTMNSTNTVMIFYNVELVEIARRDFRNTIYLSRQNNGWSEVIILALRSKPDGKLLGSKRIVLR